MPTQDVVGAAELRRAERHCDRPATVFKSNCRLGRTHIGHLAPSHLLFISHEGVAEDTPQSSDTNSAEENEDDIDFSYRKSFK